MIELFRFGIRGIFGFGSGQGACLSFQIFNHRSTQAAASPGAYYLQLVWLFSSDFSSQRSGVTIVCQTQKIHDPRLQLVWLKLMTVLRYSTFARLIIRLHQ